MPSFETPRESTDTDRGSISPFSSSVPLPFSVFVEVCLQLLCTQVWRSLTELLARARGSVIRQALASCGAPGSSNITPLSKLNTGLWRHCIVVQARAEQGSCLQKKERNSYGPTYRKIRALLCRLFPRATDRTQQPKSRIRMFKAHLNCIKNIYICYSSMILNQLVIGELYTFNAFMRISCLTFIYPAFVMEIHAAPSGKEKIFWKWHTILIANKCSGKTAPMQICSSAPSSSIYELCDVH